MPSVLRSTIKNKRKRKSAQCFCDCEEIQKSNTSSIKESKKPTKLKNSNPINEKPLSNDNKPSRTKKIKNSKKVSPTPEIKNLRVILTPINLKETPQTKCSQLTSTTCQDRFKTQKSKLRKRKTIKYVESSLELTKSEDKLTDMIKIPIYKQQLRENNLKRQKNDLYEFDSDTEKNKKRRKLNDSSVSYEIPTKIKKPTKTRRRQKGNLIRKKNAVKKTDKEFINQNKSPERTKIIPTVELIEASPANNFNFCEVDEIILPKSPKIKILSNIQLEARNELNISIASPACFKNGNPDANSTMIAPNKVLTPWRFNDINITRNPHFISIKNSSLPRIDQELVLNHTIVDKLNNSLRSNNENYATKTLKQSTLSDFFKVKEADKENLENSTLSLFDIDQFSPIKSRNGVLNNTEKVKRRILGDIHDNNQTSSARNVQNVTPPKTPNLQDSITENNTDFGFDSSENSNPIISRSDKPYRLSISMADRKYCRKPKTYFQKEKSLPSSSEDDSDNESYDDIENAEIKLFDDLKDTQEMIEEQEEKTAKIKKLRKQRRLEKKQKDVRSKEEEEEAEKWAAQFNSMCEEIEQFPLEIE